MAAAGKAADLAIIACRTQTFEARAAPDVANLDR
jgi:hypothetical protein